MWTLKLVLVVPPGLKLKCWLGVQAAIWPLTGQAPNRLVSLKLSASGSVTVTATSWARSGPLFAIANWRTTSLPGVCRPAGPVNTADRSALGGGGGGGVWRTKLLWLSA